MFDEFQKFLIDRKIPSFDHMEYDVEYMNTDFASCLTFTMNHFYNKPHQDNDINPWTLVGWIPIFEPVEFKCGVDSGEQVAYIIDIQSMLSFHVDTIVRLHFHYGNLVKYQMGGLICVTR